MNELTKEFVRFDGRVQSAEMWESGEVSITLRRGYHFVGSAYHRMTRNYINLRDATDRLKREIAVDTVQRNIHHVKAREILPDAASMRHTSNAIASILAMHSDPDSHDF